MAFTALAAGVSGLQAFSQSVGVIADNITNVNTIGYKESRSRFSTLVTETSSASSYSPGGVRAFTESLISRQGLLQPSSSPTDLSVDGAGFFVVKKSGNANEDGEFQFTRAGSFSKDEEGFFRNTAGLYLMGWKLDATGGIPSRQNDLTLLEPINIDNLNGVASATGRVSLRANLQSSTSINAAAGTYAVGDMAAAAATPPGTVTADFETTFEVFDSQGISHTVVLSAIKSSANDWSYEMYFDNPSELDAAHTDGLIASGSLLFNSDGSIDLVNSTMNDIGGNPVSLAAGEALTFTYGTGVTSVDNGNIVFNVGTDGQANGFSQFDSPSTLIASNVTGAQFGNVNDIRIGEDGFVYALFDNGLQEPIFRLPVATFPNPDGLARKQGNAYSFSNLSGNFALQTAGQGGAGAIAPNALELSTVDLANEFAELIKVQRAFSASTRIITTSDEILEELVRI